MNTVVDAFLLYTIASDYYRKMKSSHALSSDEIYKYQLEQVRKVLIYSGEKVPYYKKLFSECSFDPSKFKYLDELERLPYLDKETVRTHASDLLSDDFRKLRVSFVHTSGSTGTPLTIAQDIYCRAAKYALVYKYRHLAGYSLRQKAFSLWGVYATTKKTPFGYDAARNVVWYANNKMTESNSCAVGIMLNKHKPVQYEGYARSFLELGETLEKNGIPIWSPKSIFCYGDCLTDEMRCRLTELYKTNVVDFYSHVENAVAIAEIIPGDRLLVEDYCYPEIINKDLSGTGELVGTSFFNFAMPLIRYRTRDLVMVDDQQECQVPAFRHVKSIVGRQNDYLSMPDGRKILSLQRSIYGVSGIVASQFIQKTYTDVELRLVVDSTYDIGSAQRISETLNNVCAALVSTKNS